MPKRKSDLMRLREMFEPATIEVRQVYLDYLRTHYGAVVVAKPRGRQATTRGRAVSAGSARQTTATDAAAPMTLTGPAGKAKLEADHASQ